MARLYHFKGDSSDLYLIHSFSGNPRKISCDPVGQRLLSELDYEPGVKQNSTGDKIPADLLWALWKTNLVGTGDIGKEDAEIKQVQQEGDITASLQESDIEVLEELIESYTGQPRKSLEKVAELLGLTLDVDSTTGTSSSHDDESSSGLDIQSIVNNSLAEVTLEAAGVSEDISATEFREWCEETVTSPQLGYWELSVETTRTLVFLAQHTDTISVEVIGTDSSEDIKISADIRPDGFSGASGTLGSVRVRTGDYLAPLAEDVTGPWDDGFQFVDWEAQSSATVPEADTTLDLATSITMHSSGVSGAHTGIDGGSGHLREEFVARRHQTDIVASALRRHINNHGPFALPDSRDYTEYTSSVEFHDAL